MVHKHAINVLKSTAKEFTNSPFHSMPGSDATKAASQLEKVAESCRTAVEFLETSKSDPIADYTKAITVLKARIKHARVIVTRQNGDDEELLKELKLIEDEVENSIKTLEGAN